MKLACLGHSNHHVAFQVCPCGTSLKTSKCTAVFYCQEVYLKKSIFFKKVSFNKKYVLKKSFLKKKFVLEKFSLKNGLKAVTIQYFSSVRTMHHPWVNIESSPLSDNLTAFK